MAQGSGPLGDMGLPLGSPHAWQGGRSGAEDGAGIRVSWAEETEGRATRGWGPEGLGCRVSSHPDAQVAPVLRLCGGLGRGRADGNVEGRRGREDHGLRAAGGVGAARVSAGGA